MTARRTNHQRRMPIGLVIAALVIIGLWQYGRWQGGDPARGPDRDIAQLEATIEALEARIESGSYPALEEHMKRQLEERREELNELRARQAENEGQPSD